ncbi:condensation domain-containing protein [Streptosporangium sp. NBC_01495]|uniref:condensation domain-containing protein n=1 Tax=Streptosporangium sp. NBC_01495 TaxID=2903899 RepID=UPI002E2ED9A9|nr:condensation domain-containing protein [Streptosporangium sp. NBC_01495]
MTISKSADNVHDLIARRRRERDRIPRHAVPDSGVPVSSTQERIWFGEMFNPGFGFYHVPATLRLRGPLDAGALDRALCEVIRRHEILRSTVEEVDGMPVQRVGDAPGSVLRSVDLGDEADAEAEAARMAADDILAPFDLRHGPLWRALLLRLGPDDHVLVLTFHHIVFDDPSFGIVGREVEALYTGAATGTGSGTGGGAGSGTGGGPASLPDLDLQYTDFSVWQRERLRTEEVRSRLVDYWRRTLDGVPRLLDLPSDRPRPPHRRRAGRFHRSRLSGDVVAAVRAVARDEGTTPFTVLLAAYGVLLSRYAGQADIVTAVPAAGRIRPELEALVGCFINIICLRLDLRGEPTFRELLRRVRHASVEGHDHEEMPFEELVRELHPQRPQSHTPLFQAGLGVRDNDGVFLNLPGVRASEFVPDVEVSHFDLMVDFSVDGDGMAGLWGYNDDLFDPATVEVLAEQFALLVAKACGHPDLPVGDLSLPPAPRLPEPGIGGAEGPAAILAERVRLAPGSPAVTTHAGTSSAGTSSAGTSSAVTLTYAELDARAETLAPAVRRGAEPPAADSPDPAVWRYAHLKADVLDGRTAGAGAAPIADLATRIGLGVADTVLTFAPPASGAFADAMLLALLHGAHLVTAPPEAARDAGRLKALVADATVVHAPPAAWRLLLQDGLPADRPFTALCDAATTPPGLARELAAATPTWTLYGEHWAAAHRVDPLAEPRRGVPLGEPLAGTPIEVVDRAGRPGATGVPGEIHVGGAATGDRGRTLPDGSMELLGRFDRMFTVGGFRVDTDELARSLAGRPGVAEAAVDVRHDRLAAYVAGEGIDPKELTAHLPEYQVPGSVTVLDSLPRTAGGHIAHEELPSPDAPGDGGGHVPIEGGTEEAVAGIWRELLGVEEIGASDGFLDLGGHSLTLARLSLRYEVAFGVEVELPDLLRHATVREQAALLDERRAQAGLGGEGAAS